MQEAMLACINITKPTFEISAAKLATQKIPIDMVLQNGQFYPQQTRQTAQILIPDCKSQDTSHMDSFLRQQTWMAWARNARSSDVNEHDLLYPKEQGKKGKGKGCHVLPHHLLNEAQ